MIITFEIGDKVNLDDHIEIPGDLANAFVKLIRKSKTNKNTWLVRCENTNNTAFIHERWFDVK